MSKNNVNYKLLNLTILAALIFLLYHTGYLWMGVIDKVISISLPFLIAFVIAYALYPFMKFLTDKGIPKPLSILIIVAIALGILAFIVVMVIPLLFSQLGSLFNDILAFIKEISVNLEIDIGPLTKSLSTGFNDIILSLGKYISNGAFNIIGVSLGYISTAVIAFSAAIYFLTDMEAIRNGVKEYLSKRSKKVYRYISLLDNEMKSYLTGFIRIMLITIIEYSLAYTIIGHPNALLLGFLAMVANLIPYFGGMITNVIAAVTAFVISPNLFIRTVITFAILSALDGYLINPLVYGKTNKVHPIIVIMSVFAGGILFGVIGIVISLPLAIIIITTIKYFKTDISDKIEDIKEISKVKKRKTKKSE